MRFKRQRDESTLRVVVVVSQGKSKYATVKMLKKAVARMTMIFEITFTIEVAYDDTLLLLSYHLRTSCFYTFTISIISADAIGPEENPRTNRC